MSEEIFSYFLVLAFIHSEVPYVVQNSFQYLYSLFFLSYWGHQHPRIGVALSSNLLFLFRTIYRSESVSLQQPRVAPSINQARTSIVDTHHHTAVDDERSLSGFLSKVYDAYTKSSHCAETMLLLPIELG
uniref:Uncharacterized protein n=1 Tax=Phlegmariurus squarrosus TaxID=73615 RepID=H9M876_PHLSQ|nr:hypothetical protein HusqMp101 [Phlegmariurus squarrosus]AEV55783.1 hypothetical protein HusqMp101 [Phlegmariurus squarrosus]